MLSALAALAILSTSPIQTAQEGEEIIRSLGAASYAVGLCERFMPPDAAPKVLRRLSMASQPEGETKELLQAVTARMYLQGQLDPRRADLTAENCSELLILTSDGMGEALARVRANTASEP